MFSNAGAYASRSLGGDAVRKCSRMRFMAGFRLHRAKVMNTTLSLISPSNAFVTTYI